MNERIKELIDDAWDYDSASFDKEKFAYLIIDECIKCVNGTPMFYRDYRNQIEESMRDACEYSIRERFGTINDL